MRKSKHIVNPSSIKYDFNHYDEELVKLSKEMLEYAVYGLKDLQEMYRGRYVPKELLHHEIFYKNMISACSIFLAESGEWPINKGQNKRPV